MRFSMLWSPKYSLNSLFMVLNCVNIITTPATRNHFTLSSIVAFAFAPTLIFDPLPPICVVDDTGLPGIVGVLGPLCGTDAVTDDIAADDPLEIASTIDCDRFIACSTIL
ncbi:hypothetical protein AX774_g4980 [Zancudomyces culisetae]|uniref:Uncharacterized protein n=1 Tax=Zancudomyces culisetae TaxID=1213189 RepID=A0A1R1PKQ0_ZANCU|nr:hypothetical protein AX774_g4980 [Zancudomyces culisetae]|eukprot:OMH81558.1 hypothetical protein AX774_g4980 [Zancudomyces culisetae]